MFKNQSIRKAKGQLCVDYTEFLRNFKIFTNNFFDNIFPMTDVLVLGGAVAGIFLHINLKI